MNLTEFLATASTDDETALTEAQAYSETRYTRVTSNELALLVIQNGLYGVFIDTASDAAHAARDHCLALMDRVRTQSTFSFDPSDPAGQANRAMLDDLIVNKMPGHATALNNLWSGIDAQASESITPFAAVTLYQVKVIRESCPLVEIAESSGYAVINVSVDVEMHNPRLIAYSPRTDKLRVLNHFQRVGKAGKYEAQVPSGWRSVPLYIDDAYGVIS